MVSQEPGTNKWTRDTAILIKWGHGHGRAHGKKNVYIRTYIKVVFI